ncbi:MAG TPA: LLM class flavin-dependent oxidoreductase [Pseudonocardia sp.]
MTLHLAVEIDGDGDHPEAWRRATHPPRELLTPRRVARVAAIAENAGFTLVTLDDEVLPPAGVAGRVGAIERAAFVAASTSVLAVAPVVSTTYAEPFHVSSQLATLDHLSAGRAGWVVSASADAAAARAWGRPQVPAEGLGNEARDAMTVVVDLWDSWEDDAVIRDVTTSRYLDRDRLHYIDFTGDTFAVKGPAIVPRPPQGRPVVFAPPALIDAGVNADVALVSRPTRATAAARTFVEVEIALDTADATAEARIAALGGWPNTDRQRYTGTAAGLVAWLAAVHGQVDGVRLHALVLDEDLAVLSSLVVPSLLEAGVVARPLPGATLRTTLGLPRPVSRFAAPSTLAEVR